MIKSLNRFFLQKVPISPILARGLTAIALFMILYLPIAFILTMLIGAYASLSRFMKGENPNMGFEALGYAMIIIVLAVTLDMATVIYLLFSSKKSHRR